MRITRTPKVAAAILICDRKSYSQMIALPSVMAIRGVSCVYLNIESDLSGQGFIEGYKELIEFTSQKQPVIIHKDIWTWKSTWRKKPEYDQDQSRLYPIVMGRNMARSFMLDQGFDYLFFIDADVTVKEDALEKLLALNQPITGGLVPGRGVHNRVKYVAHANREYQDPNEPRAVICAYGTMGCCLIRRDVLSVTAFRFGASRQTISPIGEVDPAFTRSKSSAITYSGTPLSEDPAFASDAYLSGFGRWYIHRDVIAEHHDDPNAPLTQKGVSRDAGIPI